MRIRRLRAFLALTVSSGIPSSVLAAPSEAVSTPREQTSRSYDGPLRAPDPIAGMDPLHSESVGEPPGPDPTSTGRPPPSPSSPIQPRLRSARPLDQPPAPEPFRTVRVRPALDITIAVGIAAPTLAVGLWVEPSLPRGPSPEPGTEPDVSRLDAVALNRFSTAPNVASNVLLIASVVAPLVYHAVEAAVHRRGWGRIRGRGFFLRYGTDLIVFAQTMAVNALFTQLLKSAIRRPRPYAYLDANTVDPEIQDDLVAAQERFDANWSFPSGHASAAFAASTAGATLLTLELLGRANWAVVTAWLGGTALAATTAAMRTLSGKHFPSDVITGALVGAASGVAVPLAHWRPARRGDWGHQGKVRPWAVTALPQFGGGGLGVVGSFSLEARTGGLTLSRRR